MTIGSDDSKASQKFLFFEINFIVVNKISESMGINIKKTLNNFFP